MKLFRGSIFVFCALASFSSPALAQSIYWDGGTSGSFTVFSNWNTSPPNLTTSAPNGSSYVPTNQSIAIIDNDLNNGSLLNDEFTGASTNAIIINLTTETGSANVVAGLWVSNYLFLNPTTGTTINNTSPVALTVKGNSLPQGDLAVDGSTTLNFNGALALTNGIGVIGDNDDSNELAGRLPGTGTLNLISGTFSADPLSTGTTALYIGYSQTTPAGDTTFGSAAGTVNVGVSASGTNVATSATVTTGNLTVVGYNGASGVISLNASSSLQTGVQAITYTVQLGANGGKVGNIATSTIGSVGILNLNDTSSFILNSGGDLQLGTVANNSLGSTTGGTGTINQGVSGQKNGGPNVSFLGTSTVEIGDADGGTGTYNLIAGTLTASNTLVDIGVAANSTGTLNQSGGSLNAGSATSFILGDEGTATYNLAGGGADFQNGLIVGNGDTGVGTVNQSGGIFTATNSAVILGAAGIGNYNLSAGTATFNAGLEVNSGSTLTVSGGSLSLGATSNDSLSVNPGGTVNQTGGTVTINAVNGQSLFIDSTASYSLDSGGLLQLGETSGTNGLTGTGSLNFGGGTLQITSTSNGTFIDPLSGTDTNVTIIDAATVAGTTNVNFTGTIQGTGGLTMNGNGATTFDIEPTTGNDSFGGAISINGGTLIASMDDVGGATAFNIGANSTFDMAVSATNDGNFFAGSLNGPASALLNVSFPAANGTLVILNGGTYNGSIVLGDNATGGNGNGGTLQLYNGTFGSISDNGTGSSLVVGGNPLVTPTTGAVIPDSGTVNITSATYSGLTTVTNGFTLNVTSLVGGLDNNGTTTTTSIGTSSNISDVTNSGTLTADSVTGNVYNSAASVLMSSLPLPVGNTPTFTVGGNFQSNGTLVFRTAGPNADDYAITGTANVTGSTALITGYGSTPSNGVIVLTSSGLTGVPTSEVAGSHLLYNAMIEVDSSNTNDLVIIATQSTTGQYAKTANERAVAASFDPLLIQGKLPLAFGTIINGLSAAQIPVALDELSPEVLQYSRTIAFENSTFLVQSVDGALANVRSGYAGLDASGLSVVSAGLDSGIGRSLASMLAYNPPSFNRAAPNGVNYYPQPADYTPSSTPSSTPVYEVPAASSPAAGSGSISDTPNPDTTVNPSAISPSAPNFNGPVMSEFILGNAVLADMNQNQSAPNAAPAKASYTSGGATGGISFRMTNNLAAGILFDYNHTDATTDGNGSKTNVNTYSPGVYATYFNKGFYVNGMFSFGYNTYSNTRNIGFLGTTANSSPTGQQYVTNLDGGYDFQPRNHREWIFGPTAGLTYTHLDIGSFNETGAGVADLAVNDQSLDSLRSRLGGHVIYQARAGSLLFQPNLSVMWQHEYLDNPGITSQLNIPGTTPFTIQTATTGKDSALLGAGVTMTLDNSMAFYLNYSADVGQDNFWAQSILGGFKASF